MQCKFFHILFRRRYCTTISLDLFKNPSETRTLSRCATFSWHLSCPINWASGEIRASPEDLHIHPGATSNAIISIATDIHKLCCSIPDIIGISRENLNKSDWLFLFYQSPRVPPFITPLSSSSERGLIHERSEAVTCETQLRQEVVSHALTKLTSNELLGNPVT